MKKRKEKQSTTAKISSGMSSEPRLKTTRRLLTTCSLSNPNPCLLFLLPLFHKPNPIQMPGNAFTFVIPPASSSRFTFFFLMHFFTRNCLNILYSLIGIFGNQSKHCIVGVECPFKHILVMLNKEIMLY